MVEPCLAGLGQPALQSWRSGPREAAEASVSVLTANVPTPVRPAAGPSCSSSRYALNTVFGLMATRAQDLFDGRELIALVEEAEFERPADLSDHLQVGRHPRPGIQNRLSSQPSAGRGPAAPAGRRRPKARGGAKRGPVADRPPATGPGRPPVPLDGPAGED